MARYSNDPTILEETDWISIAYLRYIGCFDFTQPVKDRIECDYVKMDILVDMTADEPYMQLSYYYYGQRSYWIDIVSRPSNLGKGYVWYFVCPYTGRLCTKLYFVDGHFGHRTAFENCYYERQTQSKFRREICKEFSHLKYLRKIMELMRRRNAKLYYRGEPTKQFARLTRGYNKGRVII